MGTPNTPGQTGSETIPCEKVKDILLPYKKSLKSEKTLQKGVAIAARTEKDTQISNRDFNVCYLIKGEEAFRLYRNIDIYVANDSNTIAESVEKNIDELVKKSDELEKAIEEATKALYSIKDKAKELKAKACDLDTQSKDSCNSQQLNILNEHFSSKCKVRVPGDSGIEFINFQAIIDYISGKSSSAYSQGDKSFNSVVSISGIQTFSSIKNLKEIGKQLAACIKDFKKDVDTNAKLNTDEQKKAQDELAKAIKEVTVKTLNEHKESAKYEGVAFSLDFVCNPECSDIEISKLCCKVMEVYCGKECEEEKEKEKDEYSLKNCD